jgi:hypothetical protein
MNWQQFLQLLIVLGVGAIFVWRSSSPKKHEHSANCGCSPEDKTETKKENDAR